MSFPLKISRAIDNHIWKISFSVDSSKIPESDKALMLKFGEPSISVGGIYGTISQVDKEYVEVTCSSSLTGREATFTVSRGSTGSIENVVLVAAGIDYTSGEILTVSGTAIGGTSTVDDLYITVDTVLTAGEIATFSAATGTIPALQPGPNFYSLPTKYIRVRTDLPYTQIFDSRSEAFAENTQIKAQLFEESFVASYVEAFMTLRAMNDTFTGEAIVNV
jgi:hypothetical protein